MGLPVADDEQLEQLVTAREDVVSLVKFEDDRCDPYCPCNRYQIAALDGHDVERTIL
jgi:hypothetical protein